MSNILILNKTDHLFLNLAVSLVFSNSKLKFFSSARSCIDTVFNMKQLPDLIIVDLNIGELSAKAFITLIAGCRVTSPIPIMVLSKTGHEDDLIKIGAHAFYRMPDDLNDLLALIIKIKSEWKINSDSYLIEENYAYHNN